MVQFLYRKILNTLRGTMFVVCLLVNNLFLLFLQYNLELHDRYLFCGILTLKNIIGTLLLAL